MQNSNMLFSTNEKVMMLKEFFFKMVNGSNCLGLAILLVLKREIKTIEKIIRRVFTIKPATGAHNSITNN